MINKKELKDKSKSIQPVIRIGKSGLTENAIKEIKKQLKKKKLIKVKFLRSFISDKNKKQAANEIAEKTESILIDSVGFVVVLWKD
ncbi:MAG: YhbY family RNA-binding protein [Candidatus Nanoarchaeia archaeon]|nr:YhbY family RNA-binding protein [Candidatus Nanoarchaeia archaeon]